MTENMTRSSIQEQRLEPLIPPNSLHQPLEGMWRVTEPELHSFQLTQAKRCTEHSLTAIFLINFHLVVTICQVNGGKPPGTTQSIQRFFDAWKREHIFPCFCIELPIFHTEPYQPIFLPHYHQGGWSCQGCKHLCCLVCFYPLLKGL